jgi:hypothetical protein
MFRGIARSGKSARLALGLALAGVLACGAAPASAATVNKPSGYKLALPAPGHVSVAAVEVTVRKHGRGTPASRLALTVPNRFALPDSVRVFYARHRISTAPLRYELLLLSINRVSGRSATKATKATKAKRARRARSARTRTQFNVGSIVLTFPTRPAFGHTCGSCGKKLPLRTNCKRCWFRKTGVRQVQVVNADTASATQLASLVSLLRTAWTVNGDSNLVFGNPTAGTPRDPTLDGGHYDDNRAFGWERASLRDPGPALHGVVDDLLTGQQQQIIPGLEVIGQADLNGNGVLDGATTPGGGSAP